MSDILGYQPKPKERVRIIEYTGRYGADYIGRAGMVEEMSEGILSIVWDEPYWQYFRDGAGVRIVGETFTGFGTLTLEKVPSC